MKTSTVVLIGVGIAAAIGIGVFLSTPTSGSASGGGNTSPPGGNLQGQLPAAIPMVVGTSYPIALPENASTGAHWVLATSDSSIVDIQDGGVVGAGGIGTPVLHKYTLVAGKPGSATLTAVLMGPDGKPAAKMSPLSAVVTVTGMTLSTGGNHLTFR